MKPPRARRTTGATTSGLGVDAAGGPVIDPTANVIALVEAETQRQDDLRDLTIKYLDARLDAMEKLAIVTANHQKEIREIETKRVDAVRQVDVGARDSGTAAAARAIETLAAQQRAEAETIRNAVGNTAATLARSQTEQFDTIGRRIAALEQTAAMGAGKQQVADPAMEKLTALVTSLATTQQQGAGRSAGGQQLWGYIVGGVMLLLALWARFGN